MLHSLCMHIILLIIKLFVSENNCSLLVIFIFSEVFLFKYLELTSFHHVKEV